MSKNEKSNDVLKVAMLNTFTLKEMRDVLQETCQNANLNVVLKNYTSYNLGIQEISDPESELNQFQPEILYLFIDLKTFIPDYLSLLGKSKEEKEGLIVSKLDHLKRLVQTFKENHSQTLMVIHNFEVPDYSPVGILDNKQELGLKEIVRVINRKLETEFRSSKDIFIFDYDGFLNRHGKKNASDQRLYYLADMKLNRELLPALSEEYFTYLKAARGKAKKCIVLDLDNTLWGGIVGEDGLENLKLGPTPPGNAFLEFQQILLSLFHKGIILAINSKNNPEDALKVIREHPYMVLKESHFAAMKINWQDKATNIKELAQDLNIGMDSMVFFDDDQYNRLLVKSVLPEVLTVDLPTDPSYYVETLMKIKEFDTLQLTEEDKLRGQLYSEERQRRELKESSADFTDFLRNLEMKVTVEEANNFTIPRLSQLSQRTNQFNLTTKRYTEADMQQFNNDENCYVCSIHVKDKLGDTGIVGCSILKKQDDATMIVDTFLMSCRVIGRHMEKVLLGSIIEKAKLMGAKKIVGKYRPTVKNVQTKSFYEQAGFSLVSQTEESSRWSLDITNYEVNYPNYMEVIKK